MTIDCIVCLSSKTLSFKTKNDERKYWHCKTCYSKFLDPSHYIEHGDEKERYLEHKNIINDAGYRKFLSKVTNPLQKLLKKDSLGLDYGCGHGPALADILEINGFKVDLYDPFFYPNKSIFNNKYKFVTCTEVAEHFFTPSEEFNKIDRMLEKNGILAVMTSLITKDVIFEDWYYRRDPTHVVFYSEKSLHLIAKQRSWSCWEEDKNVFFFKKS